MQAILITFALMAIIRVLLLRRAPRTVGASVGIAIKEEVAAWLMTVGIMLGIFLVVLALALVFGPIPQVHEWARD